MRSGDAATPSLSHSLGSSRASGTNDVDEIQAAVDSQTSAQCGVPLSLAVALMVAAMCIVIAVVGIVPIYLETERATLQVVEQLRKTVATNMANKLEQYYQTPLLAVLSMEALFQQNVFVPWALNETEALHLLYSFVKQDPNQFITDAYLWIPSRDRVYTIVRGLGRNVSHISASYIANRKVLSYPVQQATTTSTRLHIDQSVPPELNMTMTGALIARSPAFQIAFEPAIDLRHRWAPRPSAALNSMHIAVALTFTDDTGVKGVFGSSLLPAATSTMLSSLGLGPSASAFVVHAASSVVVGTTWNQTLELLNMKVISTSAAGVPTYQWQNILAKDADRMTFVNVSRLQDGLIQRVLAEFGPSFWKTVHTPASLSFGTGTDTVLVDVVEYADAYGLTVRTVIAQPIKDYLGVVYETRSGVLAGVIVAVALLICVSAGLAYVMARPIQELGEHMLANATLGDDDGDDASDEEEDDEEMLRNKSAKKYAAAKRKAAHDHAHLSRISELALAQASYSRMRAELQRAKLYLPQSVIFRSESDEFNKSDRSTGPQTPQDEARGKAGGDNSDTHSQASQRSGGSRRGGGGGCGRNGALNTALGMSRKSVAVAAFNCAGWHSKIIRMTIDDVLTYQHDCLAEIERAVLAEGGIVDFFQGDRVVATFNAVTSAPGCFHRAAAAAVAAVKSVRKRPALPALCGGVAKGSAMCGNSGTDSMRHFNIVGPVYGEACSLAELAVRRYKRSGNRCVLAGGLELGEVQGSFMTEAVDIAKTRTRDGSAAGGGGRLLVSVLHEPDSSSTNNSAFDLAGNDSELELLGLKLGPVDSPFRHINACFAMVLTGRLCSGAEGNTQAARLCLDGSSRALIDAVRAELAAHHAQQADTVCAAADGSGAAVVAGLLAHATRDADLLKYAATYYP